MKKKAIITFKIFTKTTDLPDEWDSIAKGNLFLSLVYFKILESAAPSNMICRYIGIYKSDELAGICFVQIIDLNQLESFGERDSVLKKNIRKFVFKNFCSNVLFVGNNMLTGQNAYIKSSIISLSEFNCELEKAVRQLKNEFAKGQKKIQLVVYKDFNETTAKTMEPHLKSYYKFSTQPNMIFTIHKNWHSEEDFVMSLQKKYRDQYKRARKKLQSINKRKLDLLEIKQYEDRLYELYLEVAKQATFNTFFLRKNHFHTLKKELKNDFLLYGYFKDDVLIGFNTLLKNGTRMETYFLGYDKKLQRDLMLYLNMLYDMIGYSIKKGFQELIFARTALEIKSSVGAKPENTFGFIKHSNPLINLVIHKLFCYLEPKTEWKERNPFKQN